MKPSAHDEHSITGVLTAGTGCRDAGLASHETSASAHSDQTSGSCSPRISGNSQSDIQRKLPGEQRAGTQLEVMKAMQTTDNQPCSVYVSVIITPVSVP